MSRTAFVRLLVCVGLLVAIAPSTVVQGGGVTYGGRAIGVLVSSKLLDGTLAVKASISDTGPLPKGGGIDTASLVTANVKGLVSAGVLQSAVVGLGDKSRSEASVAKVTVGFYGLSIQASLLASQAEARCVDGNVIVSGHSEILDLTIDGKAITVTGSPNQTLLLTGALGKIVSLKINEQSTTPNGITVTALRLSVLNDLPILGDLLDVAIAQASARIDCAGGAPVCTTKQDFVTGFGFFNAGGARADFSFAAGVANNGSIKGALNFTRAGGPKVVGKCLFDYEILNATTRRFKTVVCVNGICGQVATVTVEDNANPDGAGADKFTIVLSTGATYSGVLEGGNISIHEPCS